MAEDIAYVQAAEEWPKDEKDYVFGEVIGVGPTGKIYLAYCRRINKHCAIKRIKLKKLNGRMAKLKHDQEVMMTYKHENITTHYTSFIVKNEMWLVTRLLENGSLLDIIQLRLLMQDCSGGVMDETTIATVLKEVLKGLEYLHKNGQIHKNIKPGNILFSRDGVVQIADFGISLLLAVDSDQSSQKRASNFMGIPYCVAPEALEKSNECDFKADIWNFGITAIEMVTGKSPYYDCPKTKAVRLILQNDPPSIDSLRKKTNQYKKYGKSIRKMIADCLQKDPEKRPTASELLKCRFIKKAKNSEFLVETLLNDLKSNNLEVEKKY